MFWNPDENSANITVASHIEMTEADFQIDGVSLGMTADEIIEAKGQPLEVAGTENTGYYPYNLKPMTTYKYEGMDVYCYNDINVLAIEVYGEGISTPRGVCLGDDYGWVVSRYGRKSRSSSEHPLYYFLYIDKSKTIRFDWNEQDKVAKIIIQNLGF